MSYTVCPHFKYSLPRMQADETIRMCVEALSSVEFDAIAFSGISGALIASVVAYKMNKEIIVVRKNGGNDGSHSAKYVEGYVRAGQRVVIIDDLICTGATMRNIVKGLNQFFPSKQYEIVGVILYDETRRRMEYDSLPCLSIVSPPSELIVKWKEDIL